MSLVVEGGTSIILASYADMTGLISPRIVRSVSSTSSSARSITSMCGNSFATANTPQTRSITEEAKPQCAVTPVCGGPREWPDLVCAEDVGTVEPLLCKVGVRVELGGNCDLRANHRPHSREQVALDVVVALCHLNNQQSTCHALVPTYSKIKGQEC